MVNGCVKFEFNDHIHKTTLNRDGQSAYILLRRIFYNIFILLPIRNFFFFCTLREGNVQKVLQK